MRITTSLLAAALLLGGCVGRASSPSGERSAPAVRADAVVRDSLGRDLGTLSLIDAPSGIRITGSLRGLPPGTHAFHVHTTGACAPTFDAAGGHWNPAARQHGRENAMGPHRGDAPNILVAADGSVVVDATTVGGALLGAEPLLDADGAAIVVHARPDDQRTDPTGGAGSRIACGVLARR